MDQNDGWVAGAAGHRACVLWSLHLFRATVGHVTWRRGRQVVDCGGWPAGYTGRFVKFSLWSTKHVGLCEK